MQGNYLSPSHSESPYTGRWCTLWGRPDSLQYMTGCPASPLQRTGYSVSAPSPQTAVCQSETHGNIKKGQRVKITIQGTEPGVYLDSSVRVLSASAGIFKWKLVLLAPDRFLPFFPSLDKWGAEYSWTGHTSRECWGLFPTLETPPEIIRMPWQHALWMFSLNNWQDKGAESKTHTLTIQEGILMVSPSPVAQAHLE